MKKILIIAGTRPEVIKLAPVYFELRKRENYEVTFISSGQHSTLLDQAFRDFEIAPDADLKVMSSNQTLAHLSEALINNLTSYIEILKPDLVLVQGDTTTAFIGALAAYYLQIPVAHVEAGLRTSNKNEPFPEEINRRLISVIADIHFAPTQLAKEALMKEGITESSIYVTGNTGIDSLFVIRNQSLSGKTYISEDISKLINLKKYILITCHRRESFGQPLLEIISGIKISALSNPNTNFVVVLHPNPKSRNPILENLQGITNIVLIEAQPYGSFIELIIKSQFVVTDSGGTQEEGATLGKKVLVLRDKTERGEAVATGHLEIIGTDAMTIVNSIESELVNEIKYTDSKVYGDGAASKRIADAINGFLHRK